MPINGSSKPLWPQARRKKLEKRPVSLGKTADSHDRKLVCRICFPQPNCSGAAWATKRDRFLPTSDEYAEQHSRVLYDDLPKAPAVSMTACVPYAVKRKSATLRVRLSR